MNTYNTTERTTARLVPNDRLNAITSLIGEGAVFEGSFHSKDDLGIKVDGQLIGGIVFENGGAIHIGPTGLVENTTIEADYIFIEGKVKGNVIARKSLEISGSATVLGDIVYDALIDIHPRARLRGKIDYRGDLDSTL
ncbi:MAG TPA: polymer-forming cytoskeletal protein [Burkholderiaceae bacterium]|jgi:cytoskeletal protein CcmA (bactofilin family)|nr:polymer-forming cytoskeletal protein [Polaromonas sp.]MBK7501409.1 polymer-forming cytoskeletal protein [Polaromonas sp.]HOZ66599.1 polymer-forming cytoskeletal protein [Burkholderiaceae bacterium]